MATIEKKTPQGRRYVENGRGKVVALECTACRRVLPLDRFTSHPRGFAGRKPRCRECVVSPRGIDIEKIQTKIYDGKPVLTNYEIAALFDVTTTNPYNMLRGHVNRFIEGIHYYRIKPEGKKGETLFTYEGALLLYQISDTMTAERFRKVAEVFGKDFDPSDFQNALPRREKEFGKELEMALDGITTVVKQMRVDDYRIDFYLPEYKLAIEYDEEYHGSRKEEDAKRQAYLEKVLGCRFVRVRYDEPLGAALNKILWFIVKKGESK